MVLPFISFTVFSIVVVFLAAFSYLSRKAKTRLAATLWKALAMLPLTCVCALFIYVFASAGHYAMAAVAVPVWLLGLYCDKIAARVIHVLFTPPEK